jgi:hypothetical protein
LPPVGLPTTAAGLLLFGFTRSKPEAATRVASKTIGMDLNRLSNAALLRLRFCDLPVDLAGTVVERRALRVFEELAQRGLTTRPTIWLSEEWFNPDGVNGFAIAFYLVHPRLIRLERTLMLEAEGAAEGECLRILRHETGHAMDEAFQLYRTPSYRRVFGSPSRAYPASYAIKAHSRDHVLHLNAWYAQSHPVEDFAETFAVWLRPKHIWRRQYRDWPALEKLEAVDRWMTQCAGRPPEQTARAPIGELAENQRTLAEHYEEKRTFYGVGNTAMVDATLRQIFPGRAVSSHANPRRTAVGVLRAIRTPLRKEVGRPLGVPAYVVDQVLRQLIQRARALDLRHTRPTDDTIQDLVRLVSLTTMDLIKNAPRLPL